MLFFSSFSFGFFLSFCSSFSFNFGFDSILFIFLLKTAFFFNLNKSFLITLFSTTSSFGIGLTILSYLTAFLYKTPLSFSSSSLLLLLFCSGFLFKLNALLIVIFCFLLKSNKSFFPFVEQRLRRAFFLPPKYFLLFSSKPSLLLKLRLPHLLLCGFLPFCGLLCGLFCELLFELFWESKVCAQCFVLVREAIQIKAEEWTVFSFDQFEPSFVFVCHYLNFVELMIKLFLVKLVLEVEAEFVFGFEWKEKQCFVEYFHLVLHKDCLKNKH